MTYVKAVVSPRARKYLATVEGRRRLLMLCLGIPETPNAAVCGDLKPSTDSTPSGETKNHKR